MNHHNLSTVMNGKAYGLHSPDPPQKILSPAPPPSFRSLGPGPSGQDHDRSDVTNAVKLEMRDYYAIQAEFIKYVDLDLLVPKLITQRLVTEGEAYAVKNPYIVPHQRVFQLFQYISNKGPFAPAKLLQCLLEPPLHQGHAYLASRLLKEPQPDDSLQRQRLGPNPEVKKRLTKLKAKFAGLLIDTHKYLRDVPVSMQDLKIFVSFLTASDDNRSSLFFNNHIPRISSASSIDEIFSLLSENHYWTHLDYHILEAVVDRFGNKHLRKLVDSYTQEVDEFQNNTKLSDYCSSLEIKDTAPMKPDFTPVKARFDSDWQTYGMSQMQNVQSQMCQHFKLSSHSMMFQSAEPGSVCVTWLVPSSVEATVVLRSKELHEVFKTMGMLSLTIGKYSVLSDEEDVEENSEDALYMNSRRVVSKTVLSHIQSQELLNTLEAMEDKLNDMTVSFEEHKSTVMSILGGGRSETLTSVSTITEETSKNYSSPLAASTHKIDSMDEDFELVPEAIHRRRESDYGCNAEEWTGGDSGYGDPARWRQVSHFSSRPSSEAIGEPISEEEEENEQYVELEDYVPEQKKTWNQKAEIAHPPHQRLSSSPQPPIAFGSLQNRAKSLEKDAKITQSEVLPGQTQFKRKPVLIKDRPPAVPPRPPH